MNEYTIRADHRGEYAEVRVKNGTFLVDVADLELALNPKWFISGPRSIYCKYVVYTEWNNGKTNNVSLHRVIMQTPKHLRVDHEDGNGLNCRRYNMRNCTHSQNMSANHNYKRGKSGLLGVYETPSGTWRAMISSGTPYKAYCLGTFATAKAAALVRDREAFRLRGRYARLNYPDELTFQP